MDKQSKSKRIIIHCFKNNIGLVSIVLLLLLFCSLLALVNPIIYKYIIDDIIPSKKAKALILPLLFMIFVPWMIVLLNSLKNFCVAKLSVLFTGNLRKECFQKCLHAKQESLESISSDQIVHRIMRECGRIGEVYLTNDLVSFVGEFVSLITILITMLIYDIKLTLICCIAFPISFFLTKFVAKRSKTIDNEMMGPIENGQIYLSGTLRKIKLIKLKNGYQTEYQNWSNWLDSYKKVKQHSAVVHNVNRFLVGDLIINLIYGILFFISGMMVINGNLSIGELVIFISFVPRIYTSLRNVLNIKVSTEVINNAFQKIDEIIDIVQERTDGIQLKSIDIVSFRNIDFSYNRGDFHLSNFNLNISKGKKVGIVGSSGGGKSTIFELLTALYSPQSGNILINNTDINTYNVDCLRSRIAVVTQNVDLFNTTIRHNIAYPSEQMDEEKLMSILKLVHLDELIQRLPNGLDTYVGENGDMLSGGEKQRISIANSLLHDSDIILLDEFTSALDPYIEKELINAIMQLSNKAVIMISHRIYNIVQCDTVLVMRNGEIIERGNPKELLSDSNSSFSKLYSNIIY